MYERDSKTLLAGQTLDCTSGTYSGKKVVAMLPVGYGAKCCARSFGNTTGAAMDYATTGVYAADGSTAADVPGFTPDEIGFDKVTVPAGSSPVKLWLDFVL